MGVLKRLTTEYFGDTERLEDRVVMDGVIRVDFTDRNGKRHRNGYRVEDGNKETLEELIGRLISMRGPECDLNDIDVSNVEYMDEVFNLYPNYDFNGNISGWDVSNVESMYRMFFNSKFNGNISDWEVSNVQDMNCMFCNSSFNGNISDWKVSKVKDMRYMFENSPLENNPPEWYKEK